MKLLVVTSRFPYPLEKGDKLRIFHQLRYLNKEHDVTLVSIVSSEPSKQDRAVVEAHCDRLITLKIPGWKRLYNITRGIMRGWPLQVGFFYDDSITRAIRRLLIEEDFDHVYCQLVRTAEYVRKLPLPKTIDYMDALSAGFIRRSQEKRGLLRWMYRREGQRLAAYEAKVYPEFDHHTIISERDRNELPEGTQNGTYVIPNGLNTDYFKPLEDPDKEYDIVFVGNMGYEPNVEAAIKLVSWVKPLRIDGRALTVLIAGARPSPRVKKLKSDTVEISGWVEDIRESYSKARVFAAPVFTGAGLQNKILEAMGMGIPCITTSMVNGSINAIPDESILVADDKDVFKTKLLSLLGDTVQCKRLANNAMEFVHNQYSWDEFNEQLDQILKKPIPRYGYTSFDTDGDA